MKNNIKLYRDLTNVNVSLLLHGDSNKSVSITQ